MTVVASSRLAQLASDPSLAPLARLQEIALAARARPAWRDAAAAIGMATDAPALDGAAIRVSRDAARSLLHDLATAAGADGIEEVDPVALLEASIAQREVEVDALASIARIEPSLLAALGQVLAWPLLLAVGERAREEATPRTWDQGFCPVCAAWPLLAELRGIDRARVLRCGRCSSEWPARHILCPFCGNDDHRTLALIAPDGQRETRRIAACDRCHGYVKSFATLRALDAEDLAFTDLTSVDLDLVASDRGYGRPTERAFALRVTVEEAS